MRNETGVTERLAALVAPVAGALGYDIVRVRLNGGPRPRLQIMAERPDGTMSIDDCAALSRALSAVLDVEDPVRGEYTLEVSSPGIDRPLVRREDFSRYAGREAKIELAAPRAGRRRFKGVLRGMTGDTVLIESETGQVERLPYSEIDSAKLALTEALIAESLKGAAQPKPAGGRTPTQKRESRNGHRRQRQ